MPISKPFLKNGRDYPHVVDGLNLYDKHTYNRLCREYRITGDSNLRAWLIGSNIPSVIDIAGGFYDPKMLFEFSDIVGFGIEGLIESFDRFNPDAKTKRGEADFFRYSHRSIKYSILTNVFGNRQMFLHHLNKDIEQYVEEYDRKPSLDELAEYTGHSKEKISGILTSIPQISSLSDDEGYYRSLEDSKSRKSSERLEARLSIEAAFERLNFRERDILTKRFGLDGNRPMKLREIGRQYHIKGERIRQIGERALRKVGLRLKVVNHYKTSERKLS